ncbi:gel scht [Janthinobacterium sp. HH01]|uniref:hypothetical protein n=1 Tax=Janthinobacterium sp. HH01 TaxID=1198452 RepID=UPI0002AEBFAB|nr:hypothetical protein [Janthinobacterium sp. HH01]ELX11089.1 gel scht [Janthinobacterium sp. HH01]
MTTSKTKAKAANSVQAKPKGKPLESKDVRTAQQKEFSAVVDSIAKRYGVKVAAVSTPEKNPYAMSAEQAEKIALQAGIITRTGNLTRRFK